MGSAASIAAGGSSPSSSSTTSLPVVTSALMFQHGPVSSLVFGAEVVTVQQRHAAFFAGQYTVKVRPLNPIPDSVPQTTTDTPRADTTAVRDALWHAVRDLDVAITRIATFVVTDAAARAFVAGLDSGDLRRAVEDLAPIADIVLTGLRSTLVSSVLEQLQDHVQQAHQEADMPDGPLRDFKPICDDPDVAAHIDKLALSEAQLELQHHPDDEAASAAAVAVLQRSARAMLSAMRRSVVKRCNEEDVVTNCKKVVDAANADFRPIYESVWTRIFANEGGGAEGRADKGGVAEYKTAVDLLEFPAAGSTQTAIDAVELLLHAAKAQPGYCKEVRAIVDPLSGVQLSIPPVRAPLVVGWLVGPAPPPSLRLCRSCVFTCPGWGGL